MRDLNIRYYPDNEVVNAASGIDLELKGDETLGLASETDAGKTTMTFSTMGLLPPKVSEIVSGDIVLDGEELVKSLEKKMRLTRGREVAMIFRDPMTSLDPLQAVEEQIGRVILLHNHFNKQGLSNQMGELMEKVGFSKGRKTEYSHQFFGGMKQRVMIAIVLAYNPKLLAADEPATALGVTIQAQILNSMEGLKREYHTFILLITHDLGIVVEIYDRVAIVYAKEIVESGGTEQIYNTSFHPYTQGPPSSVPGLDGDEYRLTPIDGLMPDPTNLSAGRHLRLRRPYAVESCKTSPPTSETENGHCIMCWYWEKQKEGN